MDHQQEKRMSKELTVIPTRGGDLQIVEFAGGGGSMAMQLCQGNGTVVSPDTPGFIQLDAAEIMPVVTALVEWLKGECERRREKLSAQIAADKALEKTIFGEIRDCARFITDLEVPAIAASLLISTTGR